MLYLVRYLDRLTGSASPYLISLNLLKAFFNGSRAASAVNCLHGSQLVVDKAMIRGRSSVDPWADGISVMSIKINIIVCP